MYKLVMDLHVRGYVAQSASEKALSVRGEEGDQKRPRLGEALR